MKELLEECLTFLNENNVPNSESLRNQIQTKLDLYKDSEIIGYVSKEDIQHLGFDTSKLNSDDLINIVDDLFDSICDNGYWETLEYLAGDKYKLPKLSNIKGTFTIDEYEITVKAENEEAFLYTSDYQFDNKTLTIENIKEEITKQLKFKLENLQKLAEEIYNEIN